jgi:acetyl esterase
MALHPVIETMLAAVKASGWKGVHAVSVKEARKFLTDRFAFLGNGPEVGGISECEIATRGGMRRGRLYRPRGKAKALIVYFHGGGWVIGSIDDYESMGRFLADRTGCAVLLASYRLAPEHPFPAAVEDCYDALVWADAEMERLVGARVALIVAGDSAGGNLSAVSARLARDAGKPKLALQILIYPTADVDLDTPTYREYAQGFGLSRADCDWFYNHYLQGQRRDNPLVAPLRTLELKGAAPAFVVTAEYDVLRDEGEAYARRLAAAGVPVTLRRYQGVTHGFINMANVLDVAERGLQDISRAIAATLEGKRNGGAPLR